MDESLHLLVLEDSATDAELMIYELHRAGFTIEWQRVETKADYLAHLTPEIDLILADYSLPQFDASQALTLLQKQELDIPMIIVTGAVGEEVAVSCIKQGAADYLLKDRLTRLGEAVRHALREKKLRQERQQMMAALRKSERQFRKMFELSPLGIAIINPNKTFEQANQAAERMFGYTEAELQQRTFLDITLQEDVLESESLFNYLISYHGDYYRLKKRYYHKDGKLIWCDTTVFAVRRGDKRVHYCVAMLLDITEGRQAEESAKYLATIVQSSDDAIISLTLDGTVVSWNKAAESIYGYTAAEMIDQHSSLLLPLDRQNETRQLLRQVAQGHSVKHYETERQHKNGSLVDVSLTLSPIRDEADEVTAAAVIAHDITKRKQTELQVRQANERLAQAYDETLLGWAKALELRDGETEGHSQRVASMTIKLARQMGLTAEQLIHVRRGALLHDIGKMAVPDHILLKPGPLTDAEWKIMRQHPIHSYEMLSPVAYLRPALEIPYCHHERWDGSGYPRGLSGQNIPLVARIFAVVDVWDALRSDRPYRSAWPLSKVYQYMNKNAGVLFDPVVTEKFLQMISTFEQDR